MSTSIDHRKAAEDSLQILVSHVQSQAPAGFTSAFLNECAALAVAIRAFHMEGIRFRMFNVDRMLSKSDLPFPAEAAAAFKHARESLEAAGFHTRSHQA